MFRDFNERPARDECLPLSIQDLLGDDPCKRAAHERTALAGPEQLFPRNAEQEFEQVTVKIRIALLVSRAAGEHVRSELPAQRFESCQVFLKRRKVAEPVQPALISREGCSVPFDKAAVKPGSRPQVFGNASE